MFFLSSSDSAQRTHNKNSTLQRLPPSQAREITNGVAPEPFRWTAEALLALQEVRGFFFMFSLIFLFLVGRSFASFSRSRASFFPSSLKKQKLGDGGLYRAPVRGHQPVRDPRQASDDQ